MEPRTHQSVEEGVGDGDDAHALMVGHEGAHDRRPLTFGHARWGEVDRFIESIAAARAEGVEGVEIAHGGVRIDHGGERRGVGRDHEVVSQAPLEAESWDAEVGVLVGELHVAGIVGGFGDSPGRVVRSAVVDLPAHD